VGVAGTNTTLASSAEQDRATRAWRRLLLLAGSIYLAWWFIVEALLPRSYNPLPGRLAVVASFLATFAASYASVHVRRHLGAGFAGCLWLATLHYYDLVYRNGGATPWTVGAFILLLAGSACLSSRRSLLAYSLFTLVLALLASVIERDMLRSIFLPGLVTIMFLSTLSLRTRELLEAERGERIRAEVAQAAAEAGMQARDEFIAVASHELRTPLAGLQLSVQGLSRAARRAEGPPTVEALERTLERCQRQVTRLTRLVDELLDASRIAGGALVLQVERVDLCEVVRDVEEMLGGEVLRTGSVIEIGGDKEAYGLWDRTRLEQIVTNLLHNALTFGQGKPVRVTVEAHAGRTRLTVSDQGIGIEPAEHSRIFGRFERAVPFRNYGGMGLGLYVARQIVLAHGGSIGVESEPGRGAAFVVELPSEPPP